MALAAWYIASALLVAGLAACNTSAPQPTATPISAEERGRIVYMEYCNVCHPGGYKGVGPSLHELPPGYTDDQMREVIRQGVKNMPAYPESKISNEQLNNLILYIRSMRE